MGNPLLDRMDGKIGVAGRKSEKRVIDRLGAKGTPASGSVRQKGDFVLGEFLGECKSTVNGSIALQHDWLIKIAREATMVGKTPVLTLSFADDQGRPKVHGSWVMMPEDLFKDLTGQ